LSACFDLQWQYSTAHYEEVNSVPHSLLHSTLPSTSPSFVKEGRWSEGGREFTPPSLHPSLLHSTSPSFTPPLPPSLHPSLLCSTPPFFASPLPPLLYSSLENESFNVDFEFVNGVGARKGAIPQTIQIIIDNESTLQHKCMTSYSINITVLRQSLSGLPSKFNFNWSSLLPSVSTCYTCRSEPLFTPRVHA